MISESLYKKIIGYAAKRYLLLVGRYDTGNCMDVTHDVILDEKFDKDRWMALVDRYIYKQIDESKRIKYFYRIEDIIEVPPQKKIEEKLFCKNCQEFYPRYIFQYNNTLCGLCYRKINKERIKKNQKKHKEVHRVKYMLQSRAYHAENRDKCNQVAKEWKERNKDKVKEYTKRYAEENREKIKKYRSSDKYKEIQKKYRERNKEKLREKSRIYRLNKKLKDENNNS
jgi:hypothetical protein